MGCYRNIKWFYHTFLYNFCTLIVFLLQDTLMVVTEVTET